MSTVLNIAAETWTREELGILMERQNAEIHRLKDELEEMTARATSLVLHLAPETLVGDVQRWRDEAKSLLANAKVDLTGGPNGPKTNNDAAAG